MNSVLNVRKAAGSAALVFPQSQIEVLQAALAAGVRAFLLEGEPGTGKTALGRALGAQAVDQGGHFVFAQANAWASDEFLIRGIDLAGFVENDPDRVYAPGLLMTASRLSTETTAPVVVILDEWDKTRPVADGLLLAALGERIVVDAAGRQLGRIGDNVIFWITSNASRELHPALRRRVLPQRLNPLADRELIRLLGEAGAAPVTANYLTVMRHEAKEKTHLLTLPDLLRIAEIVPALTSAEAVRFLLAGFNVGEFGDNLWAAVCRDRKAAK